MQALNWFKLFTDITKWRWYKHQNTKAVFLHLLVLAANNVNAGIACISRGELAKALGMNANAVNRALKNLMEGEGAEIEAIGGIKSKGVYRIVNWNVYQSVKNTEPTKFRPSSDQVTDQVTDQDFKVENKENRPSYRPSYRPSSDQVPTKIDPLPLINTSYKEKELEDFVCNARARETSSNFRYPTDPNEVVNAAMLQGIRWTPSIAAEFIGRYSAVGWKIGANTIINWAAMIRPFESNRRKLPSEIQSAETARMREERRKPGF